MLIYAAKEGMRIVRVVEARFPDASKAGSGFVSDKERRFITAAHVVRNKAGTDASKILLSGQSGQRVEAKILSVDVRNDVAVLSCDKDPESPSSYSSRLPEVGSNVAFFGQPMGVRKPSAFQGMVSALGTGLLSGQYKELIQISGMINNGNSGGPVLDESGSVIGMITSKYVPLLQEVDKLSEELEAIHQIPSSVVIQKIDFGKFVNVTIKSMWQLAAVLRLVQVGTGWAVPVKYFK